MEYSVNGSEKVFGKTSLNHLTRDTGHDRIAVLEVKRVERIDRMDLQYEYSVGEEKAEVDVKLRLTWDDDVMGSIEKELKRTGVMYEKLAGAMNRAHMRGYRDGLARIYARFAYDEGVSLEDSFNARERTMDR